MGTRCRTEYFSKERRRESQCWPPLESTLCPHLSSGSHPPHASGSPPTPAEPQSSLTLAPLGEHCSPSPGFLPILPGFQDIRTLLMEEGRLTKDVRVSDSLHSRPSTTPGIAQISAPVLGPGLGTDCFPGRSWYKKH